MKIKYFLYIIIFFTTIQFNVYSQKYNLYLNLSSVSDVKFTYGTIQTNKLYLQFYKDDFPAIPIEKNDKIIIEFNYVDNSSTTLTYLFTYTYTFNGLNFEFYQFIDVISGDRSKMVTFLIELQVSPPKPQLKSISNKTCYNNQVALIDTNLIYPYYEIEYFYNNQRDTFISFDKEHLSFDPKWIGNINKLTKVKLRLRAFDSHFDDMPDAFSDYTDTIYLDILPPPPIIDLISNKSSCPSPLKTGSVKLNVTYNPVNDNALTYRVTPLSLNKLASIDDSTSHWGGFPFNFNTSQLNIDTIGPGWHRMYVTYQEPSIRNCFNFPVDSFFIDSKAVLDTIITKTNISCPGYDNGQIKIDITQGAGNYKMELYNDNILIDTASSVTSKTFSGLPASTKYQYKVYDFCTPNPLPQTFDITEPPKVNLSTSTVLPPDCLSPSNGGWMFGATGGTVNSYDYYIYKGNKMLPDSLYGTIYGINGDTIWRNFSSGNYTINLRDHYLPDCPGDSTGSIIPVLSDKLTAKYSSKNVNCMGDTNGQITANASGGMKAGYTFTLHDSLRYYTGNSGLYNGLGAGRYMLTTQNIDPTCLDADSTQITLGVNSQLYAHIDSVIDVRCNGEHNGRLVFTINPTTAASWESKDNGIWEPYTSGFSNMYPGQYKLTAKDSYCNVKDSATINEPNPLKLTTAFTDTRCINEPGFFTLSSTGGNNTPWFESSMNGGIWTPYTSQSPLTDGTYRVRAFDSKGCQDQNPGTFTITSPTSALSFTSQNSDYNGYNISCYGKNDGAIHLLATGGNGGTYSGYTYKLNDTISQNNGDFLQLIAGDYALTVIDGRGCKREQFLTLTQPISKITLQIISLQLPKCFNDKNGKAELLTTGENPPFNFTINHGLYQSSSIFNNLPVGLAHFETKDNIGCTQILDTILLSQISKINLPGSIYPVGCKGKATGTINVTPWGGAGMYNFSWKNFTLNTNNRTGLAAGDYPLTVTDSAGCKNDTVFTIYEPDKELTQQVLAKPVCVGASKGEIKIQGNGGTAPYRYSLNSINNFGEISQFDVDAGSYTVYTSDVFNCITSEIAKVETRSEKPDINFLVATTRYEGDTLVLKDVSMPSPDSIHWIFSPEALVIDSAGFSPRVKYSNFGSYPVQMTGWFSGCDYSLDKKLSIEPIGNYTEPKDPTLLGFERVVLKPNPNDGNFSIDFKLYATERVIIRVVDMYSKLVYEKSLAPTTGYEYFISIPGAISGTYVLQITAETDSRTIRFILNK